MHALLDEAVAAFAARPFLDFLGRRQTYAQTARLVTKAALGFQRLGVRKGTKVGLLLPNSPYSVICYFAVLKAGGTAVNYDPLCAEQELVRQIEDSETGIMVTLDLKVLYGKLAAAAAKTNLTRIVTCGMAEALPLSRRLLFRIARWRDVTKPPRGDRHVPFDELIDNDGAFKPVEIAPLSDVAVTSTPAGRPASRKA
jgi:long-chain acyl-CoA synthetase